VLLESRGFAGNRLRSGGIGLLEEIPLVAVEVFEDGDRSIGFLAGRLEKLNVGGLHEAVIAPEIVGMEKEEDAITCLVADVLELLGRGGLGEEKAGAAGARRSEDKPTLTRVEGRVFHDAETEAVREEEQGLVVIADEKGNVSESLRHDN